MITKLKFISRTGEETSFGEFNSIQDAYKLAKGLKNPNSQLVIEATQSGIEQILKKWATESIQIKL